MKSFIVKRVNSILVNLRYFRFKLLKYKENNKKICNTFDHNFKGIPLYLMRKVSLERYYFVLYDGDGVNSFCDKNSSYILLLTLLQTSFAGHESYTQQLWFYSFLPESPRWLLSKGRKEEADRVIEKLARVNRTRVPEELSSLSSADEEKVNVPFL